MSIRFYIPLILAAFYWSGFTGVAKAQSFQPEDFATETEGEEETAEEDEIETDRDSFTPATTTAGYRRMVLESAWSYIDNRNVADTHSYPELIARYGVNDWLELRVGWNYEVGGAPSTISGNMGGEEEPDVEGELERESQLSYGAKIGLTSQDGWVPQSAFIAQAGTPTFGEDTATQFFATYVAGWTFENRWKWDSSLRYGYDSAEGDHFNVWAPSTVLKFPVGEKWAAHAEYFGILEDGSLENRQAHYFSPGLHYLVTPDLEVGFRVGWGLNDDAANFFSNVGFGWRY